MAYVKVYWKTKTVNSLLVEVLFFLIGKVVSFLFTAAGEKLTQSINNFSASAVKFSIEINELYLNRWHEIKKRHRKCCVV